MAFQVPQRPVERVFIHCSASDRAEHDDVAVMDRWHRERGWSGVGYHFFVRKDGTVQTGRDLERTPAAQAGHNTGSIAICLHGLAATRFTRAQFESLIALCCEIDSAYGGLVTFHGHREVANKACPVFPYREVLGLDAHGSLAHPPTAVPDGSESGEPGGRPSGQPLLRVMAFGPAVTRLQALLGAAGHDVVEDGHFGEATLAAVTAFQRGAGLTPDGIVGPNTWAALRPARIDAA